MEFQKKKILITGGCGFIGHHLVEHILKNTDWEIVILDRLDMSGNLNRLTDLEIWEKEKHRVKFFWHDLKAALNPWLQEMIGEVDCVIHLAAATHVDRSIENPMEFVMDNVVGTANILEYARTLKNLKYFVNFSTDECFGPAPIGYAHKETDAFRPSNPYSATKAGAVCLGYSYFITYGLPIITVFTMNNFGERQHPEKLIPKCIRAVQRQEPMPIFSTIENAKVKAIGSRYWLHCRETASALLFLLDKGKTGEFYNIIGFEEYTNLEICQMVAEFVGKPLIPQFVDFHKIRPGHDIRYALDGTKLKNLGWYPKMPVRESFKKTVEWTLKHPQWL